MKKHASRDWRKKLYEIIFEADTPAGRLFDIVLLVAILLSVLVVMLESVESIRYQSFGTLVYLEWIFTIVFTLEFIARLVVVTNRTRYVFSFFGLVDLLSILPTYLGLLIGGTQALIVIRVLRLLRIFRILKLVRFLGEAQNLKAALNASRFKIIVFLVTVISIVVITGTIMYLIEGRENGFTSIPQSIYWSVVTLTTVGYGDIAPKTPVGQTIATFIMILGYGIIAVPTGIVTAELAYQRNREDHITGQVCSNCLKEGHDKDAEFCKYCGHALD